MLLNTIIPSNDPRIPAFAAEYAMDPMVVQGVLNGDVNPPSFDRNDDGKREVDNWIEYFKLSDLDASKFRIISSILSLPQHLEQPMARSLERLLTSLSRITEQNQACLATMQKYNISVDDNEELTYTDLFPKEKNFTDAWYQLVSPEDTNQLAEKSPFTVKELHDAIAGQSTLQIPQDQIGQWQHDLQLNDTETKLFHELCVLMTIPLSKRGPLTGMHISIGQVEHALENIALMQDKIVTHIRNLINEETDPVIRQKFEQIMAQVSDLIG